MTIDADTLLEHAMKGETASLAKLLELCGPKVRARIEGRIGPTHRSSLDADDVMQVTYVEAVMRLARFKGGGASGFLAWLSRMAENNLIDAVRALEAGRRPDPARRITNAGGTSGSVVALIDLLSGTMTTPSHHAAHDEAAAHLQRAISSLPKDYEKVVRLFDLEGIEMKEVAQRLGKSEGAAYMLRARAHDRLREAMGPAAKFFSKPE